MEQVIDVLERRISDLTGWRASLRSLESLERLLHGTAFEEIIRLYQSLPVCGITVAFTTDQQQVARSPDSHFMVDYDPAHEHEFQFASATDILREISDTWCGQAVLAKGLLFIGMPPMGGDGYFIRYDPSDDRTVQLCQVYYDHVLDGNPIVVTPAAVHLVCLSFATALEVARLDPPSMPNVDK